MTLMTAYTTIFTTDSSEWVTQIEKSINGQFPFEVLELHVDHIHKTNEIHVVFYNATQKHDEEGWMLSKEKALKMARAILQVYGEQQ